MGFEELSRMRTYNMEALCPQHFVSLSNQAVPELHPLSQCICLSGFWGLFRKVLNQGGHYTLLHLNKSETRLVQLDLGLLGRESNSK